MEKLVLKGVEEYLFKSGGRPTVTVANMAIGNLHDTALFIEKALRAKIAETKDLKKQVEALLDELHDKELIIEEIEMSDRQEAYADIKSENEMLLEEIIALRENIKDLELNVFLANDEAEYAEHHVYNLQKTITMLKCAIASVTITSIALFTLLY